MISIDFQAIATESDLRRFLRRYEFSWIRASGEWNAGIFESRQRRHLYRLQCRARTTSVPSDEEALGLVTFTASLLECRHDGVEWALASVTFEAFWNAE